MTFSHYDIASQQHFADVAAHISGYFTAQQRITDVDCSTVYLKSEYNKHIHKEIKSSKRYETVLVKINLLLEHYEQK